MERQTMMWSEVKADCYGGDTFDQVEPFFETFCIGDKESDSHHDDIVIRLSDLPPGTTIRVDYPCCPSCGIPREETREFIDGKWKITGHRDFCSCGFFWLPWVEEHYA